MSVRKRIWKTAAGEERHAWIVDYADQAGKRRMKTFRLKKEADAFETRSRFEITQGTHTPDSASISIAEAADLWIETCAGRRLERSTIDSYRQHIKFHIRPRGASG
jgi:integrase